MSVESGKGRADDVRVLKAVCERAGAAIGILVTLHEPTKPMRHEAMIAGTHHSVVSNKDHPRIQILSVAGLLERGLRPQLPPLVSAPIARTVGRRRDPAPLLREFLLVGHPAGGGMRHQRG